MNVLVILAQVGGVDNSGNIIYDFRTLMFFNLDNC